MAYKLPSGPRGDSPSDSGRRKPAKSSVGKAVTNAGAGPKGRLKKPPATPAPKPKGSTVGKAVSSAGSTLKPKPQPQPQPTITKSPFGPNAIDTARSRARGRVRKARTDAVNQGKMQPSVRLPLLPVIQGGYTERQRQEIIDRTSNAVQDAIKAKRPDGATEQLRLRRSLELQSPDGERRLGDDNTRRALNKLAGAVETRKANAVDAAAGKKATTGMSRGDKVRLYNQAEQQAVDNASEAKPGKGKLKVEAMGVSVPVEAAVDAVGDRAFRGGGKSAQKWARLATAPVQATKAAVDAPEDTLKSSVKVGVATAKGFVPGLVQTVKDPKKAAKETGQAYERLYGPLMRGNSAEFRRQVQQEGAGVQVALDTATAASVIGKGVGGAAKATGSSVMTRPRPKLRVAAGPTGVRQQEVSNNILKAAAQRATDSRRAKVAAKRATDENGMKGLIPGEGEVVKSNLRAQRRDQRLRVADRTSRGYLRLKRRQDEEVRGKTGIRGERAKMRRQAGNKRLADDLETLTLQGLTSRDVRETRAILRDRRDQVIRNRAPEGSDTSATAQAVRKEQRRLGAIERELAQARNASNVSQGRAEILSRNVGGVAAERAAERGGNPRARKPAEYAGGGRGVKDSASRIAQLEKRREAAMQRLVRAQDIHDAEKRVARKDRRKTVKDRMPGKDTDEVVRIDRILSASDEDLSKALNATHDYANGEVARDQRILATDQTGLGGHRAEMRRWSPVGRTLGEGEQLAGQVQAIERRVKTGRLTQKQGDELVYRAERQFLSRTKARAKERGLQEPVYVEHKPVAGDRPGSFAPGGARAVNGPKGTNYTLFDEGRYDTTPAAYEQGQAQTIKRNVNWNTVADVMEENSPADARRLSLRDAQDYIVRNNLNPDEWDIVDFNVYRKSMPDGESVAERGGLGGVDNQRIHDALAKATVSLDGTPGEFGQSGSTFAVVPKAVMRELSDQTKPSSAARRTLQKVQGGTSALILSTNPLFIPVQVASNIVLAVPGSRGRTLTAPFRRWRKDLDPDTREMVDEFLGNNPASDLMSAPRYGAATDNKFAKFYQSIVDSDTAQAAKNSNLNVLTWNRKLDEKQNAFFRHSAFFARLERDLHRPFNGAVADAQALADALKMKPGPDKAARLRELEPTIERYARHVDDMLGNWTRYTAKERQLGKSFLLFYGFMRFATKLALYTLPVKHPIATNIVRQLGQLNNDEVVDFLSAEFLKKNKGYTRQEVERAIRQEMLSQFGGRLYFRTGDGIGYVDAGRVSPLTTPIFDVLEDPKRGLGGLLSPALGSLVEIIDKQRTSGGRINSNGLFTAYGSEPEYGLGGAARIWTRDMLRTSPALRAIDEALAPKDKMLGDDSLPFSPRPLKPTTARERKKIDRSQAAQPADELQRALKTMFGAVQLNDVYSLDRVQESADYPERDRIKKRLRRLKADGKDGSREAKKLKKRLAIIETRSGMRKKAKPKGPLSGLSDLGDLSNLSSDLNGL